MGCPWWVLVSPGGELLFDCVGWLASRVFWVCSGYVTQRASHVLDEGLWEVVEQTMAEVMAELWGWCRYFSAVGRRKFAC
eukprot:6485340-Amphidinium_carterae.1